MLTVLVQAYNDAVRLATTAQSAAPDNLGFLNYFGGEDLELQHRHFQEMMKGVASNDMNYAIEFECRDVPSCKQKITEQSAMVTTATAGGPNIVKTIEVCPAFWIGGGTAYLLDDSKRTRPSPPWRSTGDSRTDWCGKQDSRGDPNVSAREHQFFATAGTTVLHELTHLDSMGTHVGLDPSNG
jgi:hypothetical protein